MKTRLLLIFALAWAVYALLLMLSGVGHSTFTYDRPNTTIVIRTSRQGSQVAIPQYQRDTAKALCLELAPSVALKCYYDLLALTWAESRFDCQTIGDQGRSHGCFQIQTELHGVTIEQAQDYAWAGRWTLTRMVEAGYPRYRTLALTRHNGYGRMAEAYARSVKTQSDLYERMGL